jgi:exportin-2 (importin alpha re-exporter)
MTLLTRMQSSKTDTYVYHFVYFLVYMMAIPAEGLTPDYIIQAVDGIQPGCDLPSSHLLDQIY